MTETGRLISAADEGSVVMFYIEGDDGRVRFLAGDGNMTRRALADAFPEGIPKGGVSIEFEDTGWGGLAWFNIVE